MRCPGQDTQYWTPGAIYEAACPKCKQPVEFFKDDTTRNCPECGHRFVNPQLDFGCAAYCQFAEQCLGTLPPELMAEKEDLLKDRVAIEMKRYFRSDFKRIGHATRVARYAERIGKNKQANMAVVFVAAYLHDIGIPNAEKKHGSPEARYQQLEGPPVATEILQKLGAKAELIDAVCDIIAHHHEPDYSDSVEFQVIYDADRIANIEDRMKAKPMTSKQIEQMIAAHFLTESGRQEARNVLIK